ncbi:hypothetical protein [uncultured Sunxiuqinia sp.]|uniref:hypothetical protein n=1 Tax=uncultured Sunxiuqinia sp. TaxID=1573825 RepID=UPI002AA6B4AB|nr:hypothetical protein [uncultured Sunxiuqinia sp.]
MKQIFLFAIFSIPFVVFAQNEVKPDGDKLFWFVAVFVAIPLVYIIMNPVFKKPSNLKGKPVSVKKSQLKIELLKDRKFKPNVLTLKIANSSKKDIDLEAPILMFRKIWTKRKFKLKGINQYVIYPLFLEAGKTHELRIDLSVFYNHDRKLKRYFWSKIRVFDTNGKKYSSSYITLRKSLFS